MKKLLVFLVLFFFLLPFGSLVAQTSGQVIFEAKITDILDSRTVTDGDLTITQQHLLLKGLEGEWENQAIEINNISDFQVLSQPVYKTGEKVLVQMSETPDGEQQYFVIDYVRRSSLFWFTALFVLLVLLVSSKKGFRALLVLLLTFLVIIYFIIPQILNGASPLLISILGSVAILFIAVFFTEGFTKQARVSFLAIFISLIFIFLTSVLFTEAAKLTGLASEEAVFILNLENININLKGLLLAGIIIGSLGVLDDVVVSQVSMVRELASLDDSLTKKEVFKRGMKVGVDHLSAMINTLFLAYAGAALPLLVLFSVKQEPFLSFSQIINNEMVATEIIRTLSGSIALILSVPIATYLATVNFVKQND